MMGLFDVFRRRPPIRSNDDLRKFIEENAAFLIQKAIYEYSRARAGHYSKVLFAEPEFRRAVEQSRWRAYPLGLAMVTEVVDGILRSQPGGRAAPDFDTLVSIVLGIFDGYAVPEALTAEEWAELRSALDLRLRRIASHPPKRAMDVPAPYAQQYFDLMPIHEKLRGRDLPTTHNYMSVTLCNIHDELTKRLVPQAAGAMSAAH